MEVWFESEPLKSMDESRNWVDNRADAYADEYLYK